MTEWFKASLHDNKLWKHSYVNSSYFIVMYPLHETKYLSCNNIQVHSAINANHFHGSIILSFSILWRQQVGVLTENSYLNHLSSWEF